MNWKERIAKAVYGADWEIKYSKMQIRDSDYYIKQNKGMIRKLKRKFPYRKWLGEARPYRRDIEFYTNQKRQSEKKLRQWERVKALMKGKKLQKVM